MPVLAKYEYTRPYRGEVPDRAQVHTIRRHIGSAAVIHYQSYETYEKKGIQGRSIARVRAVYDAAQDGDDGGTVS